MQKVIILSLLFISSLFADELTLLTFNAGLATGYVDQADNRLPAIISALKKERADLLCLQEVWSLEDQAKIKVALASIYPYAEVGAAEDIKVSKAPACSFSDLLGEKGVVRCLYKNCRSKSGSEFTNCVLNECRDQIGFLKSTNRSCLEALYAQVGVNPALAILKLLNPFSAQPRFAYHGNSGTMLLSTKPFMKTESHSLGELSTTNHRGFIKAEMQNGPTVLCTHLTANLEKDIPYAGPFKTWEEENLLQIKKIKSLATGDFMAMGDFNCSFSRDGVVSEFQEGCKALYEKVQGTSQMLSQCTFCSSNPLTHNAPSTQLDHAISTRRNLMKVERLFDQNPLSDHYGVRSRWSSPKN